MRKLPGAEQAVESCQPAGQRPPAPKSCFRVARAPILRRFGAAARCSWRAPCRPRLLSPSGTRRWQRALPWRGGTGAHSSALTSKLVAAYTEPAALATLAGWSGGSSCLAPRLCRALAALWAGRSARVLHGGARVCAGGMGSSFCSPAAPKALRSCLCSVSMLCPALKFGTQLSPW